MAFTSVFTLLTLPQTSNGFTSLRTSAVDDSAGSKQRADTFARKGPTRISIVGDPVPPTREADTTFALVRRSIIMVLTREGAGPLPASYEAIFSACRSVVCDAGEGEALYGALKLELEKCVGRAAEELLVGGPGGSQSVEAMVALCAWFEAQIALLQSLLAYLDQLYVRADTTASLLSIRALSFSLFNDRIFQNPQIAERVTACVQRWLTSDRNRARAPELGDGAVADEIRRRIPELITHLATHDQYAPFEMFYLGNTKAYYTAESAERAEALVGDAPAFFAHVRARIEEEKMRSKDLLPVGSWAAVTQVTESALLEGRLEWLANQSLGSFMDTKNVDTLADMYRLFARVDGLKFLVAAFKVHVQTTVQAIVKDVALDDEMVQRLLEFKAIADKTVTSAFVDGPPVATGDTKPPAGSSSAALATHTNQEFIYALTDAFTTGFKARRNKPAEMIARYLDKIMRKGQKDLADADFTALLDAALALYRFTDDKDVFRTFYHRALARRLLLATSASDDFEKAVLRKLETQYDPEFGMGEHMFNDLALSRELVSDYHERLPHDSPARKLSVMVLQQSFWPWSKPKGKVDLPPSMQAELTHFTEYYKAKHQGHVLDWHHALGAVTMRARFAAGPKELTVSLFQTVVLLLFNSAERLAFAELAAQTGMDDAELRRTLQSLACGKKKVLRKVPPGRDVADGDVFHFNAAFTDPRAKVHINSIQAKETPEESKRTQSAIDGDRNHTLDAAIVRVMKARKELSLEQLKAATVDAVKAHFVPSVEHIKKRIDALMEQEYLARDEEDRSKYVYLA